MINNRFTVKPLSISEWAVKNKRCTHSREWIHASQVALCTCGFNSFESGMHFNKTRH
jgi:hypothetical protein